MTGRVDADARTQAAAALALLDLGQPDLRPERLPPLTTGQRDAVAALDAAAGEPLVVVTGPGRAGGSHLLRHLAITWAAHHPGAQILLTGPDELDLRRDHLEGAQGLPALLRRAADDPELLSISAPSSRAKITTGSEIRWSAVPSSGDLSQLLVARTDAVLVDDAHAMEPDAVARLVRAAGHGPGPPRQAVIVTRSLQPWMEGRWPVVEIGGGEDGEDGEGVPRDAEREAVALQAAGALDDLPSTPTEPDPGPRDADRAKLDEIHAQRLAGDLSVALPPEEWERMVEDERARRRWERWRIHFTEDGQPREPEEIARLRVEEIERCRADVVYWALRYGVLQEPRGREVVDLPWVLWPAQVEFLRYLVACYRRGIDGNIIKAREVGASWGDRHVAWWLWWSVPGYSELVGTYDWELVDDGSTDSLFGMFRYIHAQQPRWMRPELDPVHGDKVGHIIHPDHGANIAGRRPKANFGRGRRRSRVVMDEAPYWQDKVQTRLRTALASTTECVMRQGTPAGPGDEFHRRVKAARDDGEYSLFEILWWADPRKTRAWYESLVPKEMTEEERARERDGQFVVISRAGIFTVSNAETHLIVETGERGLCYDDDDIAAGRLHGVSSLDELRRLPHVGMMDFGTGPSLAAYAGAAVIPDPEGEDPWIYFDYATVWAKTPAQLIAEDLKAAIIDSGRYGVHRYLGGDPSGRAAESDQSSWEDRLRAAGWPVTCLDAQANAQVEIGQNLADWQRLMDRGRIRIHRERAAVLVRSVERWGWSVPEGEDPADVNRSLVAPRKDKHSHPGDAGRYVVYFATRYLRGGEDDVSEPDRAVPPPPSELPAMGEGDPVADVIGKLHGGSW